MMLLGAVVQGFAGSARPGHATLGSARSAVSMATGNPIGAILEKAGIDIPGPDISGLPPQVPLTTHHSPLTTHHSPLATHHSPLTTHHSPLTPHHSPPLTPHPLTLQLDACHGPDRRTADLGTLRHGRHGHRTPHTLTRPLDQHSRQGPKAGRALLLTRVLWARLGQVAGVLSAVFFMPYVYRRYETTVGPPP